MPEIVKLFASPAFDPETVKRLCNAFDCAMQCLRDSGQGDIEPELVAEHVISIAKQGITETMPLCVGTLRSLDRQNIFVSRNEPHPSDVEFIRYLVSSARRSNLKIESSLTLLDESRALIDFVERQLNKETAFRRVNTPARNLVS